MRIISCLLLYIISLAQLGFCADYNLLQNLNGLLNSKHTFKKGDRVDLLVNSATSIDKSHEPYAYYHLPFICPRSKGIKAAHLSLTELLNGDRFYQSDYQLSFGYDQPCLRLCDRIVTPNAVSRIQDIIENDYIYNWIIDGLPASTTFISYDGIDPKKYYIPGFSLGYKDGGDYYIYNHLMLVIRYHKETDDTFSIVGFEVYPKSVNGNQCPGLSRDHENLKVKTDKENKLLIPYTYAVYWREDYEVDYNNRWKMYIDPSTIDDAGNLMKTSSNKSIHWASLVNSLVILSFVSIIVAFIVLSTFATNNNTFNSIAQQSFITPNYLTLLSIIVGSGIQLIFTFLGSFLFYLLFFIFNYLEKDSKFVYLITVVLLIGGFFAGFSSVQNYKLFSNQPKISLKKTLAISSLSGSLLISIGLIVVIITNICVFDKNSPRSLKFGSVIIFFIIYIILQIPISIFGGLISLKFNFLTKTINKRSISQQQPEPKSSVENIPVLLRFPVSLLIIGICPYSIVFIESRFLFTSLSTSNTSSLLYIFLILSTVLLFLVMMEIGIISSYFRLTKFKRLANWQWWVFYNCSLSIWLYLTATSIYYLFFKMQLLDNGSHILYIVYSIILNTVISLACGSSALWCANLFLFSIVFISNLKKD